jgi:U3 small nucleolar ribonucleoprotein component
MDVNEIENEIKRMFIEERCVVFKKELSVKYDPKTSTYELDLHFRGRERPWSFIYQGTKEDFLKCVRDQIRISQFDKIEYWDGYRIEKRNL